MMSVSNCRDFFIQFYSRETRKSPSCDPKKKLIVIEKVQIAIDKLSNNPRAITKLTSYD